MTHHHTPAHVAMVSEHASPLAALGGPDAGGQNVYVAQLAGVLARRGHHVTVYTRRDSPRLPDRVRTADGVEVVHVPAGPAAPVPKDELPPYMLEFGAWLGREWAERRPDVVHAHFWMSGTAALAGARELGVPVVQTYHALGTVKRRHQRAADTSPADRIVTETVVGRACDAIIATCADEVAELQAMGLPRDRMHVVPCGVDPEQFAPRPRPAHSGKHRLLTVGGSSRARASTVRSAPWPTSRTPNCSSRAARNRPCSSPSPRRNGCWPSPGSTAWPTASPCSAGSAARTCPR